MPIEEPPPPLFCTDMLWEEIISTQCRSSVPISIDELAAVAPHVNAGADSLAIRELFVQFVR